MKLLQALAVATAAGFGVVRAETAEAQTPPSPAPAKPNATSTSGFYAGAGINLYFLDRDYAAEGLPIAFDDQPSPGAWIGTLGFAFNQYVAVEVEAGIGGASSDFGAGDQTLGNIGIDSPLGAHVVLSLPVGGESGAYLFGKLGYVSAQVTREYRGRDAADLDLSGATFGGGAGFRAGSWDFRMDYSFMSGGDSGDGGVLGMGVLKHF